MGFEINPKGAVAFTGVTLQGATPGTSDVGNANLSGTFLAKKIGNSGYANLSTLALGTNMSLGTYTGSVAGLNDNLFIGNHVTLSGLTTNNTGDTIWIGSYQALAGGGGFSDSDSSIFIGNSIAIANTVYIQNAILIGVGAIGLASINNSVGIGRGCSVGQGTQVVIGAGARATAFGSTSIGYNCKATGPTANLVIVTGADDSGLTNVTALGSNLVIGGGRNNSCTVGIASQTDCIIGAYRIGGSIQLPSTVAGLVVGAAGMRGFVTDALAPAFGAAVAGGGAVGVPVYHDGTSWKVG